MQILELLVAKSADPDCTPLYRMLLQELSQMLADSLRTVRAGSYRLRICRLLQQMSSNHYCKATGLIC